MLTGKREFKFNYINLITQPYGCLKNASIIILVKIQ